MASACPREHAVLPQGERPLREMALGCVCRLLWVYLFRWRDQDARIKARIDQLVRLLFPDSKRVFPQEVAVEYFVSIVHYIAMWNPTYGVADVILPLVTVESSHRALTSDGGAYADRVIIGTRGPRAGPRSACRAGEPR